MASPTDFMSRVVVWPGADDAPGYVNVHWLSPKGSGMRGRPFKHLHEFMSFVEWAAGKPGVCKEIYFCTSTQSEHGKPNRKGDFVARRLSSKAMAYKAIFLETDVKPEAYPDLKSLIAAVNAFVKAAGLPPPSALVLSGGGVHVYWISTKPLTPEQWRPYAEGLKAEAIRLGLKFDAGCTADPVRVMRVPGTFNNKTGTPRPVKLLHLGDSYDFTAPEFMALAAKAPATAAGAPKNIVTAPVTTAFTLPPEFAKGPSKLFAHLDPGDGFDGIGSRDLPLDKAEVFKGCYHFQDSFRTHGKSQSQGLWMLTGLACTWLEGGREVFHTLSRDYPTYTPDETDKMFERKVKERAERNLGWPSCQALEGEGAKCKQCPYYQKLRSPLHLAERVAPPPAPPPPPPEGLDLPDDYTVDEHGRICEIEEKEDKNGNTHTQAIPLFWCQLRNFQTQSGDRKLLFETSLDMDRWEKADISETSDLINEVAIIKALRKHGVKPNTKISAKRIITFVTSFMAKLDASRKRQVTVPFGWLREDDKGTMPIGFSYGGRVVMSDGSKNRPSGYSDRQLETFYAPKGVEQPWWDLLQVITARHHPALECIVATSFAAPLSYATGLYNGVVSSWSPGSGAHKSTSMRLGAAIWGSPKLTMEKPDSTKKGVIHKMGLIKNLPVFWDEINTPEKLQSVVEILGSTEGSGGSKLTSGRDFHIFDEWQTLMQVGANRSMVDHIVSNGTSTDAQLQRVFEYRVEKRADTAKHFEIDRLTNALDYNYGHIGMRYSALLGRDVHRIHALVASTLDRFSTEVQVQSEERFRCAIASSIYVGALLGNELGCNFNTAEIWTFMKNEFLQQRNTIYGAAVIAGTNRNSASWLSQFLKAHPDNASWVDKLPPRLGSPVGAMVFIAGVDPKRPRPVFTRLAVSDRVIDISNSKFKEWLALKKVPPSVVVDGLVQHHAATTGLYVNMAAGVGVQGGGREPVIRIPVPPGSPLEDDLFAHTPPDQRPGAMPITATVIPIDRSKP